MGLGLQFGFGSGLGFGMGSCSHKYFVAADAGCFDGNSVLALGVAIPTVVVWGQTYGSESQWLS